MVHEIAHALGFATDRWSVWHLIEDKATDDPHFNGPNAIAAFDSAGGTAYDGSKVPLEPNSTSHWRESIFRTELMSPAFNINSTNPLNPLSAITIQAFADMGYTVDDSYADAYALPSDDAAPEGDSIIVFDMTGDVRFGPVTVINEDGTLRMFMPPGYDPARYPPRSTPTIWLDRRSIEGAPPVVGTPKAGADQDPWRRTPPPSARPGG